MAFVPRTLRAKRRKLEANNELEARQRAEENEASQAAMSSALDLTQTSVNGDSQLPANGDVHGLSSQGDDSSEFVSPDEEGGVDVGEATQTVDGPQDQMMVDGNQEGEDQQGGQGGQDGQHTDTVPVPAQEVTDTNASQDRMDAAEETVRQIQAERNGDAVAPANTNGAAEAARNRTKARRKAEKKARRALARQQPPLERESNGDAVAAANTNGAAEGTGNQAEPRRKSKKKQRAALARQQPPIEQESNGVIKVEMSEAHRLRKAARRAKKKERRTRRRAALRKADEAQTTGSLTQGTPLGEVGAAAAAVEA